MGVPVRIHLGRPRLSSTPIPDSAFIPEITPRGWYLRSTEREFDEAYTARLSRYAYSRSEPNSPPSPASSGSRWMLCFEDLSTGASCHRTSWRLWWLARTGQDVPECGAPWNPFGLLTCRCSQEPGGRLFFSHVRPTWLNRNLVIKVCSNQIVITW